MKTSYSQQELDSIVATVSPRLGWDYSRMSDWREPIPWDYRSVVSEHVGPALDVLDIGTGAAK